MAAAAWWYCLVALLSAAMCLAATKAAPTVADPTPPLQPVTLYHVFNDYLPADAAKQLEHSVVWASWAHARDYAARHDVRVVHVATLLPADRASVPVEQLFQGRAFADPHFATMRGRRLPTVFGTLDVALAAIGDPNATIVFTNRCVGPGMNTGVGTAPASAPRFTFWGRWMVLIVLGCCRDIGAYPDLYLKVAALASRPSFLASEFTRLQMNASLSELRDDGWLTALQGSVSGHPGHDCFVFRAHALPSCMRADRLLLLGTPGWGRLFQMYLIDAVVASGNTPYIVHKGREADRYTFHAGLNDRSWSWLWNPGKRDPEQALYYWYAAAQWPCMAVYPA
jgi:hypothetical protein